jgi:hypothetical protein
MRLKAILFATMLVGIDMLPSHAEAAGVWRTTRYGGFAGKPLAGAAQCFTESFGSVVYPQNNVCTGGQALWYLPQNNADDNGGLWGTSGAVDITYGSQYHGGPPSCNLLDMNTSGTEFNESGPINASTAGSGTIWFPQLSAAFYQFQFIRCVLFPGDSIQEVDVKSYTPY